MGVLTIIIAVVDMIIALALVVLVISQEGSSQGMGSSIEGGSDTFFGSGQARSKEHFQKRLTAIFAILFAILTVVLYLLTK
ncbi:MAG: preprotein translocase subunit SecG [Clostridiaceae bacterium]|jgi:preprotein translocase subunit SecG|nr:preprotein translocase subunit SecG [Bacillota bacterium]NLN51804.1 preprotein translocase subunit SecG [Clostridiaceae bacterium]